MAKKKRQRKTTVFSSIEGEKVETLLLKYLQEIYSDWSIMNFSQNPQKGGNGDRLVGFALKNSHYDRSFAWIDEDKDISKETRTSLAKSWDLNKENSEKILSCPLKQIQTLFNPKKRNPTLIVSQPVCVESLILRMLGKLPKYTEYDASIEKEQKKNLKNSVKGIFGCQEPLEYYRQNLTKALLEERRKSIPELDLLITMVSTPNQGF